MTAHEERRDDVVLGSIVVFILVAWALFLGFLLTRPSSIAIIRRLLSA